MLRALLKIIGFTIFAFILIFILYFHLSNSQTLKINFVLTQIETNVTSIILISLIVGYFLANLNRLVSLVYGLFHKNKKNQAQELEKIKDFRKTFAGSHDNKKFQSTKNHIGS